MLTFVQLVLDNYKAIRETVFRPGPPQEARQARLSPCLDFKN